MSKQLKSLELKKEKIEQKARIRQIVFGMQDGLISIVSLMAGIAGATGDNVIIILTGITAAIAGALSMGTGEYLSAKSEREIFDFERQDTDNLISGQPYLAQEGILESLVQDGLERASAYKVVEKLSEQEKIFRSTFAEKVLGIGEAETTQPLRGAIVIALAFILASLVPILPYVFIAGLFGVIVSILTTAIALFIIGAIKGRFAGLNIWISGLEFFIIALSSAIVGYFIGDLLGPIIESFIAS
ncbi:MAG: VIT1/CCC1 transporter family protein [Candidatus Hodarchaeales archaeon]|jgi:VIT1/CCC1 family predicted Fe2+/Mn2+ transporter